jgi:hypothetical protein
MLRRCYNPKDKRYARYGGRGITVCPQWRTAFDNFLKDVGECPDGLTIHRIDNDKPYEPGNVKWATLEEQAQNTSRAKVFTYKGVTASLRLICRKFGFQYSRILHRVNQGWSLDDAIHTPALRKAPDWLNKPAKG